MFSKTNFITDQRLPKIMFEKKKEKKGKQKYSLSQILGAKETQKNFLVLTNPL